VHRPAGGLVSALDPLLQSLGGVWIAWGSGDADRDVADAAGRVRLPPESPKYTLRRVWLSEQDVRQYYLGYANQLLWPLCHLRPMLTRNRVRYRERYEEVNRRFAEAVLEEAGAGGAIWFHDYHLALVPGFVRKVRPAHTLAHFWHIPFPPLEMFRIVTRGESLLEGLAANDLLGFHLPLFCDNYLRCCETVLHAQVDWERRCVTWQGHTCFARAFPISIDVAAFEHVLAAPAAVGGVQRMRARYAPSGGYIGLGIDRIDYSKGLVEKFAALDLLWEKWPEYRERLTFVQVAVPSRTGIDAYDTLSETVERMVWNINERWGTGDWKPIHLLTDPHSQERLALLYRAADLCVVSSLQDGMNLVAKEFVASQGDDGTGVLVLSKFAGAIEEMQGCVRVNPFDAEGFAQRLKDALNLPEEERRARMRRLRASLTTIHDWMVRTFDSWSAAMQGETPPLTEIDREARVG
jgi:trehalose 6-phosphate synthase